MGGKKKGFVPKGVKIRWRGLLQFGGPLVSQKQGLHI